MAKKAPAATKKLTPKTGDPQTLRILMAEDSEDDALLTIRSLKKGGYTLEYERVETAAAMLSALNNKTWDIILSDYKMPHFSGPKAITLLKETNMDIPLIIVSGTIGEETAVECMRLGARDYFIKGNLTRLCAAIERELAEALSRRERKLAEQAVIASEFRFKELFDNMSSCAAVYEAVADGTDFIFKDFNRAAEIAEKINRKKLIGKSVLQVFPGVREMGLFEVLQRVWKTGRPEKFPTTYYKDKRIEGWKENYVYKLPTGEVVALYNDITERKKAEIRIFESEEKYRMLVENSSESIFIAQDAMLKFANRASLLLFGLSSEVLTSSPFVEFIHPEDRELVLSSHVRRLQGEIVPPVYIFRLVTGKGIIKWVEIHTSIISWQGKPATLNFLNDITERRQMEEKLALNFETQAAMNILLGLSLEGRPVAEFLESALDLVLSLKWLAIESKGAIFLTDKAGDTLHLIAHNGFSKELCTMCKTVPFGHCLCGRAAATRAVQFADRVDERHDTHYEGMPPHGHYCVPILSSDRVLGVIFLYVKEGHARSLWEEDFLKAVANSLAGTIERRQAEEALRKSEQQQKIITGNIQDLVSLLDMNLRATWINPAVTKILGFTLKELAQMPLDRYLTPDSLQRIQGLMLEHLTAENLADKNKPISVSGEFKFYRKDGDTFWSEMNMSLLRDAEGKPVGFLAVGRDITARRQMEKALQETQQQLVDAYHLAEIGIWNWNPSEKTITWSEELYRITGHKFEQLTFPDTHHPQVYTRKSWEQLKGAVNDCWKTGKSIQLELEVMHPDGSPHWVNWISGAIYDDSGKIIGVHGTAQNITERKRAEEEIRQHRDHLEELVVARTTELGKVNAELQDENNRRKAIEEALYIAKEQAEAANLAKSDFLANMSHELRTPLNSVIGFSEVLQKQLFGALNEKQQEYVQFISGSGNHLLNLINDILDLSNVEAGKMALNSQIFSIKEMLTGINMMFEEKALNHGIHISMEIAADVPAQINVDGKIVKQIMFNLLSNAVKFTPDSGSVKITVNFAKDNNAVVLAVEDTGIGIKADDLPKIFLPFTQIESPYIKAKTGTGLGLAVTKRLVEMHGGTVQMESEWGKGSKVTITIPIGA